MSMSMPRFVVGLVPLAAAAAACALLLASPSQAGREATSSSNAVACTLIPGSKLLAIVGLGQLSVMRNYDGNGPVSEAVDTECDVVAWSGPTPTSVGAAFQLAKSGRGAQVGVETWAPREGSPNVQHWIDEDYDKLTGGFLIKSFTFPGLFLKAGASAKSFQPPRLGHDAAGLTGAVPGKRAKGLVVAIGCWWEDKSSSAICLFDEEAAGKPVVAHLNKLAQIAVPKFL
jgi:hypothetical protein